MLLVLLLVFSLLYRFRALVMSCKQWYDKCYEWLVIRTLLIDREKIFWTLVYNENICCYNIDVESW